MPIRVECPNGHVLTAKDTHAGRTFACPACGQSVTVPKAEATLDVDTFLITETDVVSSDSNGLGVSDPFADAFDGLPPNATTEQFASPVPTQQYAKPTPLPRTNGTAKTRSKSPQGMKAAAQNPNKAVSANRSILSLNGIEAAFVGIGAMCGAMIGLVVLAAVWFVLMRDRSSSSSMIAESGGVSSINQAVETKTAPAAKPIKYSPPKEDLDAISTKLRKIGLAFLNYESAYKRFPPPEKSELSWRVHLLPFLDQQNLYSKFHLDEPWNSPHNRSLIDYMPDIYRIEGSKGGATRIQTPVGEKMAFKSMKRTRLSDMTDGAANTIIAIVVGKDKETLWTKPDELDFAPENPFESLGSLPDRYISVVAGEGKPAVLPPDISAEELYSLLTPAGGEITDLERFSARFAEFKANGYKGATGSPLASKIAAAKSQEAKSGPETAEIRDRRKKQLREIGLAQLNYESAYKVLPINPTSPSLDSSKRPMLSWRVHILPYLDQRVLYEKFKLNEPWDSPNNIQLLDMMPEIFRDPRDPIGSSKTRLVRIVGQGTPFSETGGGPKFRDFTDGLSNTILTICAGADKSVPWTKPDDLPFDPTAPVACIGQMDSPIIHTVFADCSVVSFDTQIQADVFKAHVTSKGGEVITQNEFIIGR